MSAFPGVGAQAANPVVGQVKISGSAQQISPTSVLVVNNVIITARSSNAGNIHVGLAAINNTEDGTGNGYILEPGQSMVFEVANLNSIYVNGTANDVLSYVVN